MNLKQLVFVFLSLFFGLNSQSKAKNILLQEDSVIGEKNWGLATLSVSNMRALPDHASELVSQALMGTPLKVLDHKPGWYKVQTPDEYVGWMDSLGLARFTPKEMDRWKKSNRYVFNHISGKVLASSKKDAANLSDLVLGDLFEVESESKGFLKIRIPDGRSGFVRKADCLSWSAWTERKPDVQSVLAVARQLLGSPYLWGGTSCKAMDCSGLTKTTWFSQGIILARDASQQAIHGEHPDFKSIENLQPGDLLFFGRNADHITHVGLYLGAGKYIHASGLVQISSVDPNDPAYNVTEKKKFVAASRILNSLNTEGITLVKDHPWYAAPKNQ
ncbi:MAG: C40 family peptidase [Prolixibacteraceae bacterium]